MVRFSWRESAAKKNTKQNQASGQISIIPKPELRGFWGSSLIKPPFRVTSAEVVIICPEAYDYDHHFAPHRKAKKGISAPNERNVDPILMDKSTLGSQKLESLGGI